MCIQTPLPVIIVNFLPEIQNLNVFTLLPLYVHETMNSTTLLSCTENTETHCKMLHKEELLFKSLILSLSEVQTEKYIFLSEENLFIKLLV